MRACLHMQFGSHGQPQFGFSPQFTGQPSPTIKSPVPVQLIPHGMVATPDSFELPSSPTHLTSARQTSSLDHESTMGITSETRPDETQAPGALIPPEKQADDLTQEPPITSSPVQFLGINYVPDSTDVRTTLQPLRLHSTPWEFAVSPTSENHAAIRHPPKPCVLCPLTLPEKEGKKKLGSVLLTLSSVGR